MYTTAPSIRKSIFLLLPDRVHSICRSVIYIVFLLFHFKTNAQFPIPESLNSAAQSLSVSVTPGGLDPNWTVAYGDSTGPKSIFVPAFVVDRCDGVWPAPAASNSKWIVYNFGDGCNHIGYGCIDLYFRRIITLPATNACNIPVETTYCLDMEFIADNCVYEVQINGVSNYHYTNPAYPYRYDGYQNKIPVKMCKGWKAGANTMMVHVKSCPSAAGLLAEAVYKPYINNSFLGQNIVLCDDQPILLTSPRDSTIWFDGTVSKTKIIKGEGVFWAKIKDDFNCEIIDSITVQYSFKSFVPNVFSPNGDGINDCLQPYLSSSEINDYELNIFNRSGAILFSSRNPQDCWDGRSRGKECDQGVYVYALSFKNGECSGRVIKGDVLLIR
ncbi:MAG: gliding motility-associated C-terminal domain-containing protein [Saprospiraceae bacterium]